MLSIGESKFEPAIRCAVRSPSRPAPRHGSADRDPIARQESAATRALNAGGAVSAPSGWSAAAIAADRAAWQVLWIVSAAEAVPIPLLLSRSRCVASIAHARQLAMYLVHILLGKTLTEVGALFGRDRTTVAYACARIEDERDDSGFDGYLARLEDQVLAQRADNGGR